MTMKDLKLVKNGGDGEVAGAVVFESRVSQARPGRLYAPCI